MTKKDNFNFVNDPDIIHDFRKNTLTDNINFNNDFNLKEKEEGIFVSKSTENNSNFNEFLFLNNS